MKRMSNKRFWLLLAILFCYANSMSSCSSNEEAVSDTGTVGVSTLNIENPTAAQMMSRSYSTFEVGSASYLDDATFLSLRSSATTKGYRNDQPMTRYISFSSTTATQARVQMATDEGFSHQVLDDKAAIKNGTGYYELGNFVPGVTYYYKVTDGTNVLKAGAIKAAGQLRMIKINSSWNIRDLGGWTGWGGNRVRYEWLYRGGSLGGQNNAGNTYFVNDNDKAELHRIGIRAHLDLRAQPYKGAWPDGTTPNCYTVGYTPMKDADFMNICTDFALYNPMINVAVVGNVAWIIQELRKGKPVYFHCRTGADRTGVMGSTLLGLLGCDAYPAGNSGNQIAMDYELTSLGMDEEATIKFNSTGKNSGYYSNRYANILGDPSKTPNAYFRMIRGLQGGDITLRNFQERCYYYLNRYFCDHDVPTCGRTFINKSDLDWFVNFMLGITDVNGNLMPGHTEKFVGPEWAIDEADNSLDKAYTSAHLLQYEGAN